MKPLVSGNYLLQVFESENPDNTLLQTRFLVTEESAATEGLYRDAQIWDTTPNGSRSTCR